MPNQRTATRVPATLEGVRGTVVETMDGVLWWTAEGDTEKRFFSERRDGVWREFPGPADGPGLKIGKRTLDFDLTR